MVSKYMLYAICILQELNSMYFFFVSMQLTVYFVYRVYILYKVDVGQIVRSVVVTECKHYNNYFAVCVDGKSEYFKHFRSEI